MNLANALSIDPATILLLVALAAVFVIGLKVVRTVVSTVIISVFCGGFYVASALLLDYTLTVNRVLQFAVLGSSLYFGLKFVSGTYGLASSALRAPLRALSAVTLPFQKVANVVESRRGDEDDG